MLGTIFRAASQDLATEMCFELSEERSIVPLSREIQRDTEGSVARPFRPVAREGEQHGRIEAAAGQNGHATASFQGAIDRGTERTLQLAARIPSRHGRPGSPLEVPQPLRGEHSGMLEFDAFIDGLSWIER